ncbi:MAG: sulfate reduction electron transfer complex DsrMKJOP subunit DsrJ [candidate division KSB1 bacterium]|nr:sulfate reduction electron transfer complex DsrMKJOP subunit DsrJ [candidate division KSB1 bacterium]
MNDRGKLIALVLIVVVVGALVFPIAYNKAKAGAVPNLTTTLEPLKKENKTCVESAAYMRASHMILLDNWRNEVIREGKKVYVSKTDKKEHDMSLQNTCMKCHTSKVEFCDKCHNFVGTAPKCWDCHIPPVEKKSQAEKTDGRSKIDG